MLKFGIPQTKIAKKYGVTACTIRHIHRGYTWKHVGATPYGGGLQTPPADRSWNKLLSNRLLRKAMRCWQPIGAGVEADFLNQIVVQRAPGRYHNAEPGCSRPDLNTADPGSDALLPQFA